MTITNETILLKGVSTFPTKDNHKQHTSYGACRTTFHSSHCIAHENNDSKIRSPRIHFLPPSSTPRAFWRNGTKTLPPLFQETRATDLFASCSASLLRLTKNAPTNARRIIYDFPQGTVSAAGGATGIAPVWWRFPTRQDLLMNSTK